MIRYKRTYTWALTASLLLATVIQYSTAACVGHASDGCLIGMYETRCSSNGGMCCVPCATTKAHTATHTKAPPPPVIPTPPPVTPITPPPPPVAPVIPIAPSTATPRCPWTPEMISGDIERILTTCLAVDGSLINILGGDKRIENCQVLDDVLGDLNDPDLLNFNAVRNNCPDIIQSFRLAQKSDFHYTSTRGCRGVLYIDTDAKLQIQYTEAFIARHRQNDPSCPDILRSLPLHTTVKDRYTMPTLMPSASMLESHLIANLPSQLQCHSDVPTHEPYTEKTISVGPNCLGGSVVATYKLKSERIMPQEVTTQSECLDDFIWKRTWETFHPETGEVCPGDSVEIVRHIKDTMAPEFNIPPNLSLIGNEGGTSQWVLFQSVRALHDIAMTYTDNCNTSASLPAIVEITMNLPRDSSTHSTATVEFIARDCRGNQADMSINALISPVDAPLPIDPAPPVIVKSCRHHVPDTSVIRAAYPWSHTGDELVFNRSLREWLFKNDDRPLTEGELDAVACENDLVIKDTFTLDNGNGATIKAYRTFAIHDKDAPFWTVELPAPENFYQCKQDVPRYFFEETDDVAGGEDIVIPTLKSNDICDRIETTVQGRRLPPGTVSHPRHTRSTSECEDFGAYGISYETTDLCGNRRKHTTHAYLADTEGPSLIDYYDQIKQMCMLEGDAVNRQSTYLCLPDLTEKLSRFVDSDNCGRDFYIEFEGVDILHCSDPENIETCTQVITNTRSSSTSNDRNTVLVHYYSHNDTLCLMAKPGINYVLRAKTVDQCGNPTALDPRIFVPARSNRAEAFDPKRRAHPCDDRLTLDMPTTYYDAKSTELGSVFRAPRVDTKLIKKESSAVLSAETPSLILISILSLLVVIYSAVL